MQQDPRDCAPRKEFGSICYIKVISRKIAWLKVGGISEILFLVLGEHALKSGWLRYGNPYIAKKEPFCLLSKIARIFGCLVVVIVLMLWIRLWKKPPYPCLV